jgi:DegV family protein with EDD domain
MKLAIVTDSTCDLRADQLEELEVHRVHLYVTLKGETHRDWIDITPKAIIEAVKAGADLPTTSQPSPEDFGSAYKAAVAEGAERILVITISSAISGTFQSASLAAEDAAVPVTLFDSKQASMGIGNLVRIAASMRDEGVSIDDIVHALERTRDTMRVMFAVDTLDFLLKGGRVSKASALLGGMLNIKPILTLEDGKIVPASRARGTKKAIAELVAKVQAHAAAQPGPLVLDFLHSQDVAAAETLKRAVQDAGVQYEGGDVYEIGAVIAAHVGPGTFGFYAHVRP